MTETTHSLFFYGTLCHAAVLSRVIGNPGQHLTSQDAVLLDHVRVHVKGEDYPAVIPKENGESVLNRPLQADEASVQGVLVTGLTDTDVKLLDEFEGDEYTRFPCSVTLLSSTPSSHPTSSPIPATVYVWTAPLTRLSPSLWSFQAFLRESAHRWVGAGAEGNPDYAEVDRRRAMGGLITPRGVRAEVDKVEKELGEEEKGEEVEIEKEEENGLGKVEYGKKLRERYWRLEEGWVNINHGSYGLAPTPVVDRFRQIQDHIDSAPDRFMKLEYEAELVKLRTRLGHLVGCDTDDLVMVGNATLGINTVLRSLTTEWKKDDRLLYISTSIYNACAATLQYIVDTHPHLSLSLLPVPITYPISHDAYVDQVRRAIEEAESDGTGRKVRLALVDAISASPGVVVPWERLVKLFREKEVLSLIDAAHQIGQTPVSLRTARPDFWISNCHKWLMAHRAVAVLYVDKRYQHLIHSIPIGHSYRPRTPSTSSSWISEFVWNGTVDWSPVLSTLAALDFRRDILRGEERIYEYCHGLAEEGGEVVAGVLGTRVMRNKEGEGELIGTMVNVQLPLPAPSTFSTDQQRSISALWQRELVYQHKTHCPIYAHNNLFYTRLSAQVYLELEDFEYVGKALKEVCGRIERGEYLQQKEAGVGEETGAEEP
ncbi:hypothetical protein JCM11641_007022 [Rhodosporidiobolus odoratus]